MRTFVMDANIVLSSLSHPRGVPGRAMRTAARLALSDELTAEVERGLRNPYFTTGFGTEEMRTAWGVVRTAARRVEIGVYPQVDTDPNDLHVLALARDARAEALVTGDKRLLALDPWEGTRILRPAEFLRDFGVV